MSTQTVYFDNPASITALQSTTASMSGAVTQLQNQAGTNVPISIQPIFHEIDSRSRTRLIILMPDLKHRCN